MRETRHDREGPPARRTHTPTVSYDMNRISRSIFCLLVILPLLGAVQCTSTGTSSYYDQCEADVPDSECYATRRAPESEQVALATDIALRWIEEHPAEEQIWDWGPASSCSR